VVLPDPWRAQSDRLLRHLEILAAARMLALLQPASSAFVSWAANVEWGAGAEIRVEPGSMVPVTVPEGMSLPEVLGSVYGPGRPRPAVHRWEGSD
jgi:hypothetical protein